MFGTPRSYLHICTGLINSKLYIPKKNVPFSVLIVNEVSSVHGVANK